LIGALGVPEAFDDGGFAVPIQSGDEFPEVAAGGGFTCGLGPGSVGVFCWGQMGAGPGSIDPVAVAGLQTETLSALTAGAAHACALRSGDAFCWGLNSMGQLGNSTQTDSYMVAVPVSSGFEFSSVSAGRFHTCAIGVEELVLAGEQRPDPRGSGAIYCWGDNTDGKLGNGTLSGSSNIPVRVIEPGG
jgi:alpha-tubulin suppressor-like RCC1 family protein